MALSLSYGTNVKHCLEGIFKLIKRFKFEMAALIITEINYNVIDGNDDDNADKKGFRKDGH